MLLFHKSIGKHHLHLLYLALDALMHSLSVTVFTPPVLSSQFHMDPSVRLPLAQLIRMADITKKVSQSIKIPLPLSIFK